MSESADDKDFINTVWINKYLCFSLKLRRSDVNVFLAVCHKDVLKKGKIIVGAFQVNKICNIIILNYFVGR